VRSTTIKKQIIPTQPGDNIITYFTVIPTQPGDNITYFTVIPTQPGDNITYFTVMTIFDMGNGQYQPKTYVVGCRDENPQTDEDLQRLISEIITTDGDDPSKTMGGGISRHSTIESARQRAKEFQDSFGEAANKNAQRTILIPADKEDLS
jgi:hypothetical protein